MIFPPQVFATAMTVAGWRFTPRPVVIKRRRQDNSQGVACEAYGGALSALPAYRAGGLVEESCELAMSWWGADWAAASQ